MSTPTDENGKQLEKLEAAAETATQPEDIKRKAAAEPTKKENSGKSITWFLPYLMAAAVMGGAILFLEWNETFFSQTVSAKIHRYLLGGLGVIAVLGIARAVEKLVLSRVRSPAARFNLQRILRLVVVLGLVFIVVPVLFVNWYAAVVSLGLISLILGFALQTPISSFIGWIYILLRVPYRVGDRIQIGDARGDVIDVGYLDTTLWEIGGRHLSTDHPSGRLIKFPNTNVFSTPVYNYSWRLFPYIWNEIKFNVAYESDLDFVARTMQEVAQKELGELMTEKVKVYRDLLARTPVDHLDVQERPTVQFRASENTWIEVIVRFLVDPKRSGRVKSQLTLKLLQTLNAHPDKVLFPKSNAR